MAIYSVQTDRNLDPDKNWTSFPLAIFIRYMYLHTIFCSGTAKLYYVFVVRDLILNPIASFTSSETPGK